ncbi:MAG TPA: hypothetical protein VGK71_06810 [Nitrospirota bacterium]
MRLSILAATLIAATLTVSCAKEPEKQEPPKLSPIKVEEPRPLEGIRKQEAQQPGIKLKRDKGGEYSREISGKDVQSVMAADKVLRHKYTEGSSK